MRSFLLALAAIALCLPAVAMAHAFPDHSAPKAGATLVQSPRTVKVWFNGEIEPVFSTLLVKNATGGVVSAAKGHVSKQNHELLETALPKPLAAGTYTVYWSVIAHDGHHTHGHFAFRIK